MRNGRTNAVLVAVDVVCHAQPRQALSLVDSYGQVAAAVLTLVQGAGHQGGNQVARFLLDESLRDVPVLQHLQPHAYMHMAQKL
jgi:hypothetical protein